VERWKASLIERENQKDVKLEGREGREGRDAGRLAPATLATFGTFATPYFTTAAAINSS